ncbi:DnaD domain protein [uncultured Clostridium sp.]|uniref:DnaD domain protein n=1 Tax=uncultured Clostridium sp. TaxID=59620 RepID=UPI00280BE4F3|nr:DnaD domain protein [uncultured Clostridium sp.]
MAEKRMFAKTIIDSDAFLDMSLSTQALYFHLSMRADDDGFVNNPKKIQRMIGAGDDELKMLIVKKFIIPFESGVCVIKHWRIHNYIQKDRYKETVYKDEKSHLILKENKSYKFVDTPCIHSVSNSETQIRLDKIREDKNRLEENRLEENTDICRQLSSVWTNNGYGTLNKTLLDKLLTDVDIYSLEWLIKAIEIGNQRGKRTYSYLKGILENWKTEGCKEGDNGGTRQNLEKSEDKWSKYEFE